MFFGEKILFALELNTWTDNSKQIIFANMCFWIKGQKIGNYDETTILTGTVVQEFINTLDNVGKREAKFFFDKNKEFIAQTVYKSIFDIDEETSKEKIEEDEKLYEKLLIFPWVSESFDSWLIILLENDDSERFIWQRTVGNDQSVKEEYLPKGVYEKVLTEFLEWFKTL